MTDWWDVARVTIDNLPEVALLEIFDFYTVGGYIEGWQTLVHVCRKWRNVVFGSPRRLGLQLLCKARTPVRETLDVWPPLPIVISATDDEECGDDGMTNIIAALEHNDRISSIDVTGAPSSHSEQVLEAMEQPFPALKFLELVYEDRTLPVLPASFLGGSAPSLEGLWLLRIPFPGLPKLLLSATHLVVLQVWNIPHSGYISPEVMVTCLSVLTGLQAFHIGFESPQSRPDRRLPHPQTRTLLPVLDTLQFRGVSEYLEDLVARINVPLLNELEITFFHQLMLDTPQLNQFIIRTPRFNARDRAYVQFSNSAVSVKLLPTSGGEYGLELVMLCGQSDWQLSSLAQVCSSSFSQALISAVEHLYIIDRATRSQLHWQDDIESSQWLELLQPFTGVRDFYISREFTPRIAPVLQELVEERATEVLLPALETVFLQEEYLSGSTIEHFVAARQLAGHPVAVSRWIW